MLMSKNVNDDASMNPLYVPDSNHIIRLSNTFRGVSRPNDVARSVFKLWILKDQYYRKIHHLTREFRVKLHEKTDIARIAKR